MSLCYKPLKSAAHISPTLFRGEKRKESHNKTEDRAAYSHTLIIFNINEDTH